jgi:hypothetical protein
MYQALRLQQLINILAGLGALVFVFLLWYAPSDSWSGWPKHVALAATATAVVIGLLGNRWVFCPLWRLQPLQTFLFPYVAGEWTGTISSNWPVSKALMKAFTEGCSARPADELDVAILGTEEKPIKVTIEADLFRVSMKLETTDKYSSSHTVVVKPQLHGPGGVPRLLYLYQNDTPVPLSTDSSSHLGAAYLDIKGQGDDMVMEGTYWTARNWTKGLNTAGRISLKRTPQRRRR